MRNAALGLLAVAALLGIAWGLYAAFVGDEPEPIPEAPALEAPPVAKEGGVTLMKASGTVEASAGGGTWRPLKIGADLPADTAVRTAPKGAAEVAIGGGSTLTLGGQSELTVREASTTSARFRLDRGKIKVDHKKGSKGTRDLRIEAPNTESHVDTAEGSFTVTTDGLGTLAVAVTAGNANLAGPTGNSTLGAGQQSVSFSDGSVSAAAPIPKDLVLKIGKIPGNVRKSRSIVVQGVTEPGARVEVLGVAAKVDKKGRFRAKVRLREGANDVVVSAESVGGAQKSLALPPIEVDTKAPGSKVETQWE